MSIKPLVLALLLQCTLLVAQDPEGMDTAMVVIPAGEFQMGKFSDKGANYHPPHMVRVDSFLMDKYEVSNGEYLKFCTETGHKLPEFWGTERFRSGEEFLDYPVVGVNLGDAFKYAAWAGKRLPTEAEWEYAARGGLVDNNFPNGNEWGKPRARQDTVGWYNLIEPIGQYESNAYGLYDMGGNVWEWTSDKYQYNYYEHSESDNPRGPEMGDGYVIRGGSWHSGAMCKRVYFRKGLPGNWSDFAVGFRCVKDVK